LTQRATGDAGGSFAASEEALHQEAREREGSDDFGDPSYLEGLRVLLRAYDAEARFNDYGRVAARANLVNLLGRRLHAEAMWRQRPELLAHEIRRPIVICGLIRTGSTALHYLLGRDPGLQSLEYWLAESPQPRPPREEWDAHPDFRASVAEIEAMYAADPSLKAIHFMMADGPEECRHLMAQHFTDDSFEVNASVPSYSAWYEGTDLRPTYRRHRKLVQTIGSTDTRRRWLLKYPVHVRHLDAFLEVYPDACIVQTHRDPARVLYSYCSLITGFRAIFEDGVDATDVARRQMELWAAGLERGIEARKGRDPARFFDLHFRDFVADPIAAVKRIYAHFDQELTPEGEAALREWQQSNPQHKHGRHEYTEEIGIRREEIWDRFGAYMDHFGMERE
jgi:hypothetical protein